jgi:putative hydrolase of the HAD superfamily
MRFDTLSLDAGGVLVFPNWTRVSEALARHGVTADAGALAAAEPHVKRRLDVGPTIAATNDDRRGWLYFDLILQHLGIEPNESTAAAVQELYAYHQEMNLWEHVPAGVPDRLSDLRHLGLKLVVVSNANGRLVKAFDRLGLAQYFDCMVDSFDEGVEKPDPRLFQIALSRAGARADRTMHVGDMYHVDVVGARAAGLSAVLLDAEDLYADFDCRRVRSLDELLRRVTDL